jgi:hypothetical protein
MPLQVTFSAPPAAIIHKGTSVVVADAEGSTKMLTAVMVVVPQEGTVTVTLVPFMPEEIARIFWAIPR